MTTVLPSSLSSRGELRGEGGGEKRRAGKRGIGISGGKEYLICVPTNNALLIINLRLSSDVEILLISTE